MAEASASAVNDDLNAMLADMTLVQLKKELKKRSLKTTGAKNELILRLEKVMQVERARGELQRGNNDKDDGGEDTQGCQEDDDKSDGVSSDDDDDDETIIRRRNRVHKSVVKQSLTFRDIEESIETFNGDDKVDVTCWIKEFEELAKLCEWSDIQKVVYAKRLLRGSAKLFARYEKSTKTWQKLRKALIEEFAEVVDSHAVHQELSRRKKLPDETYQAYIYKMLDIAAQADVDARSIIQYIIEGIPDDAVNKTVLHGAKTIRELKERFTQYEAIKKEARSKSKQPKQDEKKKKTNQSAADAKTETRRCFNCGSKDHLGKACPMKDKGVKCFKCNQHGHIAKLCKGQTNEQKETAYVLSEKPRQKQVKSVEIANQRFVGVIDTVVT